MAIEPAGMTEPCRQGVGAEELNTVRAPGVEVVIWKSAEESAAKESTAKAAGEHAAREGRGLRPCPATMQR